MKLFLFFICFDVFNFAYSSIDIDVNGFSFTYTLSKTTKCIEGDSRFAFYNGISIEKCVLECGLRPHCETLNYVNTNGICELFSLDSSLNGLRNGACLRVKKSDIMYHKKPCGECNRGQVCDLSTNRCRQSECVNDTQPANGKVLGNLRGIGDVIRYKCDVGYTEKNGKTVVAKCLENGKWNATVQCLKVCDEPFIRNAAISSGGTIEGSVRTVTCNGKTAIDVNTVTSDIECIKDGSWNPDITCTKFNSVIFKVVAGNGKSALNAWRDGTESTSEKSCRDISKLNCTNHYRDPRIDEWDTLNVTKVRYSVYKNATEVAWVDFNGTGSSKMDWFQKERVIDSSYTDLNPSSRTNHFGIATDVL
ncbi:protein lev-9-like [Ruditapes philippinarum]|uniref:protein lev-9-like n=1 Tax=Ruditapes philippinarum TaxID=129788 RepID=UPI00295AB163|nr:protein lev-9-like [Ruditapes philippinarum]